MLARALGRWGRDARGGLDGRGANTCWGAKLDHQATTPSLCAMQATLSSKYQITIPAQLRRKFRLKPGMKLVFDEQAPELRAKPQYDFDVEAMRSTLGAAKSFMPDKSADAVLTIVRGYDRRKL